MVALHAVTRAMIGLAAVLGVGAVLLAGALVATAEEPEAPTVTFSGTGLPPAGCGSRPSVSSLTVPEGTPILVENHVGDSAWVRVGDESVIEVPDGAGVLLTLAVGQHDVRMVPACLVGVGTAKAVAVTVTPAAVSSGGPSTPGGPSQAPGAATTTAGVPFPPGALADPTGAAGPVGSPAVLPAGTVLGSDPGAAPIATRTPYVRSVVLDARVVHLEGTGTSKGVRLLAIVAGICVLGVTAAIIRSIVRLSP